MDVEKEKELKFEFFKKFNYHFLPLQGMDITIEQATQMSKAGGSCGGPYWPVRQTASRNSEKFEMEAKRIAFKNRAEFSVVNELPPNPNWWMKNKIYLRWIEFVSNNKKRKFKIKQRPALVVSENNKFEVFYEWEDLEKKVDRFRSKALVAG
jgi:hypothetical protein